MGFTNRNLFVRAIEGVPPAGGSASVPPQPEGNAPEETSKTYDNKGQKNDGGDGDDEDDPKARGSKSQVLADLARERDRRQAGEAEIAELKAKLEEFERAQMTDQEKQAADLKKALDRVAELESEIATGKRQKMVAEVLKDANLPAEMADRLCGDTVEELTADAQKLAEVMGFDKTPIDPSQGKSTGNKTVARTLAEAFRAHYNIN